MNGHGDLQSLLAEIHSADGTRQGTALLQAEQVIKTIATAAVEALASSSYPLLIAERLYFLGSAVVPPLERLFTATETYEVKLHAALVLLQFQQETTHSVIPWLLDQVDKGSQEADAHIGLAVRMLTSYRIEEVGDRIIARLRQLGPPIGSEEQLAQVESLLTHLDALGRKLPEDLQGRFVRIPASDSHYRWIDRAEAQKLTSLREQEPEQT